MLSHGAFTSFQYPSPVIVPPSSFFLDDYPTGIIAGLSLRKVSSTYTGPAIRVNNGTTTQDIGFDGSNNLDTTALLAFANGGSVYVDKWYDQSGNGRHYEIATNNTVGKYADIVDAGVVITADNGLPAIRIDGGFSDRNVLEYDNTGGAAFITGNTHTMITVTQTDTTANSLGFPRWVSWRQDKTERDHDNTFGITHLLGTTGGYEIFYDGSPYLFTDWANVEDKLLLAYSYRLGSNFTLGYNNNVLNTTSFPTTTLDVRTIGIGNEDLAANSQFNGLYQEHFVYNTTQIANDTGIRDNINTYYSIYPPIPSKGDPTLTNLEWWWDASRASSYPGTGTTITDIAPAGNGYNGTLIASPSYTSGDSGYFTLNGTNQYIEYLPSTSTFWPNNTSLTFELIVRSTDATGTNRPLFSQWNTSEDNESIYILRHSNLSLLVATRQNGEFDFFGSNIGTSGNWEHFFVVLEYNSPSAGDYNTTVYRNNVSLGSSSWPDYSAWEPTSTAIKWGGDNIAGVNRFWQGDVAVMRYYTKALDATERTTNYDLENAYYSFT